MTPKRSIRSALILPLVTGLLVIAAATSAMIYYSTRHALTEQFDAALFAKTRALAALVTVDDGDIEFDFADEMMPAYSSRQSPEYFQVWLPNGQTLEKSESLGEKELPRGDALSDKAGTDLLLPDGSKGRMARMAFVPHVEDSPSEHGKEGAEGSSSGAPAFVTVAQNRQSLDSVLRSLALTLGISFLVMSLGTLAVVLFSVRRGLQPVADLAGQVAVIGPANLDQRFVPDSAPEELRPIYNRLNDLLVRLQSAFERERRFTRDVSHELRTPLTEMKTVLEVAERWPEDATLQKHSFHEAQLALDNMQQLIAKLLLLAKSESGAMDVQPVSMNIGKLTRTVCVGLEAAARERQLSVSISGSENATVMADEQLLAGVLRNLMENAIAYSSAGSSVFIRIDETSEEGSVQWQIRNSAPGLTSQDTSVMFDPFWRKDSSRTDQSHNGLGLSILKSYCNLLSIKVRAVLTNPDLLAISLSIPKTYP